MKATLIGNTYLETGGSDVLGVLALFENTCPTPLSEL